MEKRILAIASAGGHWEQLQRMRPAWDGCQVAYVTTASGYREGTIRAASLRGQSAPQYYTIVDANRWQKLRLLYQLLQITLVLLKIRPDTIISTGAAPGFFALKIGKLLGAKTIWIDSIANAEELSLSGKKINKSADLWLTQWLELAGENGEREKNKPAYRGRVI